jgi:hypothetical protein
MDSHPYIEKHHHPSPGPHPALSNRNPTNAFTADTSTRGPVCGRVRGVSMDRHASIVIDITRNLPLDPHDRSSEGRTVHPRESTVRRVHRHVHRLPPSRISTPAGPHPSARPSSLPRSEPVHVPHMCSCHCTSTAVYVSSHVVHVAAAPGCVPVKRERGLAGLRGGRSHWPCVSSTPRCTAESSRACGGNAHTSELLDCCRGR